MVTNPWRTIDTLGNERLVVGAADETDQNLYQAFGVGGLRWAPRVA
jgi:hypothetical protein